VLRYLTDKWQLGSLGARTAAATSIGVAITRTAPRDDTVPRIVLSDEKLKPLDPAVEEKVFGYVNTHQTALQKLAAYLKEEAFEQAPRGYATLARCLEAVKTACQWMLERAYDEPVGVRVSIAEPDKLSRRQAATPRDNVARFLMRKKRYAVTGLQRRLRDVTVSPQQHEHAVQTLALITGRKFHLADKDRVGTAVRWLQDRIG
jgi:hypothetical protein